ncbi:TetR/AcrR family transcriptional regulator [Nocardia sp. CNY236]|uniref:TetR/AcrR family transcriptional regulator n=1 Tax=Nocardia sp. CNY236 TaxID=1169152 RepID=UPI0005643919|nr:hypothetical protein [Nocardia sp. CNY236]
MSTDDRRTRLAEAAIDIIATRGIRALTHRALDTALDLPTGSSSYYFNSRRALLAGVTGRIVERSRADFAAARIEPPAARAAFDSDSIARHIAEWVDRMLTERGNHLIARQALLTELHTEPELRAQLAQSLFSIERARELLHTISSDPHTAAADFVAVLEGVVFDRFTGNRSQLAPGSAASVDQITNVLSVYLTAR